MSYRNFILADAASALLTMTVMVTIGYFGGNSWEALRKDITRAEHWLVIAAGVAALAYALYRYVRARRTGP